MLMLMLGLGFAVGIIGGCIDWCVNEESVNAFGWGREKKSVLLKQDYEELAANGHGGV